MKNYFKIGIGEDWVFFGMPENNDEISEMSNLRYEVYKSKGYLSEHDKNDLDEYDNMATYFIAKWRGVVIGSLRLIKNNPLPTVKDCFNFNEPIVISQLNPESLREISRLVVSKKNVRKDVPRHIVMLGLFQAVIKYCLENNISGGYGFIKNKLKNKFDKINFPINYIDEFEQKYTSDGVLDKYFSDPNDSVWPIYYLTSEVKEYLDKVFNNKLFFRKIEDGVELRLFHKLFFK